MTNAILEGLPQRKIDEASATKQARIDSGEDIIVGVNNYRVEEKTPIDILEIDNTKVRQQQIERLEQIRKNRNQQAVENALNQLTTAAQTGQGNLLELTIIAARHRATLGEISYALEKVYGRYQAKPNTLTGVYMKASHKQEELKNIRKLSDTFAAQAGRRPRIMIAKLGQDGHDRGAKVVATAYADMGFDVDLGPLFQTPEEAAKQAVENDVHILAISSLAAGHKTLIPQAIAALKKYKREDILVVAGGIIPPQDHDFLYKTGVRFIFGPGTSTIESAKKILEYLLELFKES